MESLIPIIIGVLLVAGLIYYINNLFENKCSSCKKFGALKETGREIISEKQSKVKETVSTRDSKGKVIRTREILVPATTTTYKVFYQCKNCSSREYKVKSKTTKN